MSPEPGRSYSDTSWSSFNIRAVGRGVTYIASGYAGFLTPVDAHSGRRRVAPVLQAGAGAASRSLLRIACRPGGHSRYRPFRAALGHQRTRPCSGVHLSPCLRVRRRERRPTGFLGGDTPQPQSWTWLSYCAPFSSACWKMVGLVVTPTTWRSRTRAASSPPP